MLSVVVPVLNEGPILEGSLLRLQRLRDAGHEVIVVDGGSTDASPGIARRLADRCVPSAAGRSRQMNAGAAVARGEVLLFLHADTWLPEGAEEMLAPALDQADAVWGRFDVRLSGRHWLLRLVARFMNWRSRITGIATGDQAVFVRRETFVAVGGFPEIPLMEDIALSRALRRVTRPACLRARVLTSSRRWERRGILRTILLMWALRMAYLLGVAPARLARIYQGR